MSDRTNHRPLSSGLALVVLLILIGLPIDWARAAADTPGAEFRTSEDGVTLVVRETEVRDVFEMLARTEGLSIGMSESVQGKVSLTLFDVRIDEVVQAVAQAAGYAVDRRGDTYLIVEFEELGADHTNGPLEVRSFKVQYSDTEQVREILEKHLSRHGKITAFAERRMVVVEDLAEFLERVGRILEEVDRQPKQILLEAKVLEIALNSSDTLGVDWSRISEFAGTELNVGIRGLTTGTAPGLFFNLINENLEGAIEALTEQGRVRALASPRLLTMENQEAEVLVGERLGFRVTTTINQVTTESVEFIDSGVILRFTPAVDRQGRVLLAIHPEVSTGVVTDGIPSVTTTEVTTQLLADDGEQIFIGGLIRDSASEGRRGVPFLSRIPLLGLLFSRSEWVNRSTETIVIVRATVRNPDQDRMIDLEQKRRLQDFEPGLDQLRKDMEDDLDLLPWNPAVGSNRTPPPDFAPFDDEVESVEARSRGHARPWDLHP